MGGDVVLLPCETEVVQPPLSPRVRSRRTPTVVMLDPSQACSSWVLLGLVSSDFVVFPRLAFGVHVGVRKLPLTFSRSATLGLYVLASFFFLGQGVWRASRLLCPLEI